MKKHFNRFKKGFALLLTLILIISIQGKVSADNWPLDTGSAHPHFAGYRAISMLNWSPETDPEAEMLRSRVPLQERNALNPNTQIKEELDGKAEIMLMQADYGNSFLDPPL